MPSLLDLPPELRLHIYEYLWPAVEDYSPQPLWTGPTRHGDDLIRVCSQIYREAAATFYSSIKWHFTLRYLGRSCSDDPKKMVDWLFKLGENAWGLRVMELEFKYGYFKTVEVDVRGTRPKMGVWGNNWFDQCETPERELLIKRMKEIVQQHGTVIGKQSGISLSPKGWRETVCYRDQIQWMFEQQHDEWLCRPRDW